MTTTNQEAKTNKSKPAAEYVFCGVCRKRFRDAEGVYERIREHLETKHSKQVLLRLYKIFLSL